MADGITKRVGKRGTTYQARVDLGPHPETGKRRQVMETFHSMAAARAWRKDRIAERDGHGVTAWDRRPLAAYLTTWLAQEEHLRPSSRRHYTRWIAGYIAPYLGHLPLAEVRPIHIHELLYTTLVARGLAPSTRRKVHSLLHHALGDAERLELVDRNAAARVDAPAGAGKEAGQWTPEQARAFLAAIAEDKHALLWRLALHTGMRRGELCGLRWCDVDLASATLRIVQQVIPKPGGKEASDPKTPGSSRPIALGTDLVAALREHRIAQLERMRLLGPVWCDEGLVFPRDDGRALHPDSVTGRFIRIITRLGVPRIRLHDLRHVHASLLHSEGVPMRVVANRLGHTALATTARYTHADLEAQRAAATALESLLSGACVENVQHLVG